METTPKRRMPGFYIDWYGDLSKTELFVKRDGNQMSVYIDGGRRYLRTITVYGPEHRSRDGSSTYRLTDGEFWTYVFPAGIDPNVLEDRLKMELEVGRALRKEVKSLPDENVRQVAGLLYGRYKILPDTPDILKADGYCLEENVPCDAKRQTWLSEIRKVKDLSIYSNQTVAVLYDLLQH